MDEFIDISLSFGTCKKSIIYGRHLEKAIRVVRAQKPETTHNGVEIETPWGIWIPCLMDSVGSVKKR